MIRRPWPWASRSSRPIVVRRPADLARPARARAVASWTWASTFLSASLGAFVARCGDTVRLKGLQAASVAGADQKMTRAYHFGSQGPGDVFSNHTSHTNRLVPVYLFGSKADLGTVTSRNSRYRDPETIQAIYG